LEVAGFGAAVHFGIVAVAWSLAIASTILLPLRMTFMQRWVGISMRSYFARLLGPVAATVVMVVVVLLLSYWLSGQELILRVISEIAAGGVCYILCLVVLDRKTARLLVQVLRSLRQ
jgi:putative flippase GtrA